MINVRGEEQLEVLREVLVGRTVTKVADDQLQLDDGRNLFITGNDGCGGCSSGWYEVTALNECPINAIMDVQLVEEDDGTGSSRDTTYRLFVLAQDERIELVTAEGTDGNGWYGTGFWVNVREAP